MNGKVDIDKTNLKVWGTNDQ